MIKKKMEIGEGEVFVSCSFMGKLTKILVSIFFGAFFVFLAVVALATGEHVIWFYELLPLAGLALTFLFDLIVGKLSPKYVFTTEYVAIYKKGEETARFRWEFLDDIEVVHHVFMSSYEVIISYFLVENGVSEFHEVKFSCVESDIRAIQKVLPFFIGRGEFCTPERYKELSDRGLLFDNNKDNALLSLSVRARVAYLLCALEDQLNRMNLLEEWEEKLKVLWRFTSCIGVESRKEEWEKSIAKYREEYDVFPEFWSEQENLITFDEWRKQASFLYETDELLEVTDGESCTDEQFLALILQAIRKVTDHTPERDEYTFATLNCFSTYEETKKIQDIEIAKEREIKFYYHDYQKFGMYEKNERSPMFGIGFSFNGRVMYSLFCDEERAEAERKRELRLATGKGENSPYIGDITPENTSPMSEKQDIEDGIAPVLDDRHAFHETELRLPKFIKANMIIGLLLGLIALGLYVAEIMLSTTYLSFLALLIGIGGTAITLSAFIGKMNTYEYKNYPFRLLDWFLLIALVLACAGLGVLACFNEQSLKPFSELIAMALFLSAALYAVQWIYLCLLPRWDHVRSVEEFVLIDKFRRMAEWICSVLPFILSIVFFAMYYNGTNDARIMAILSMFCGSLCAVLLFKANKTVRIADNKSFTIGYRLLCFAALAGNVIITFIQGSRTGTPKDIDLVMVIFLALLILVYLIIFIRSVKKKNGE